MNNSQPFCSDADPEAIRRMQREWRIAKRKELEDKKRKKKFRAMEAPVHVTCTAAPQYLAMRSNGMALPHNSAANVHHFPFQPQVVQRQPTASSPLYVSALQVGGAPMQQHLPVEHADEKHCQLAHQHAISRIVPPQSHETMQYSSNHIPHPSRDPVHNLSSALPHGIVQESSATIGASGMFSPSRATSSEETLLRQRCSFVWDTHLQAQNTELNNNLNDSNCYVYRTAGASQPAGTHYLPSAREGSTYTLLGDHKVSHLQDTLGAQKPTADGNRPQTTMPAGHAISEETRRNMEVEEAQRRWRENKRQEIAIKRARAASSKRGRKRTKYLHPHELMGHPLHLVSGDPSLHATVRFATSSGENSSLPVSSALHNHGTHDQIQVSSGDVSAAVARSIGAAASEPMPTSMAMSSPSHTSVPFPISSVPIPSSDAVPVVPALPIQHVPSSNFGTGHDPESGFNALGLNASNQYSNIVPSERAPQNGMNATELNSIPADDGHVTIYEPLPEDMREPPRNCSAQTAIAGEPDVCDTDLMESRSHQNASNHATEKTESKPGHPPSSTSSLSQGKDGDESRIDQTACEEVESSGTEKEEMVYAAQPSRREHDKGLCTHERGTELDNTETIATMEHQTQNRKSSPSSERNAKQFVEHRNVSEENGTGKEFEDPSESFHEDGGDELMNSVHWQSLESIDNT